MNDPSTTLSIHQKYGSFDILASEECAEPEGSARVTRRMYPPFFSIRSWNALRESTLNLCLEESFRSINRLIHCMQASLVLLLTALEGPVVDYPAIYEEPCSPLRVWSLGVSVRRLFLSFIVHFVFMQHNRFPLSVLYHGFVSSIVGKMAKILSIGAVLFRIACAAAVPGNPLPVYPEIIPGPGLPSLSSLGITSNELYKSKNRIGDCLIRLCLRIWLIARRISCR